MLQLDLYGIVEAFVWFAYSPNQLVTYWKLSVSLTVYCCWLLQITLFKRCRQLSSAPHSQSLILHRWHEERIWKIKVWELTGWNKDSLLVKEKLCTQAKQKSPFSASHWQADIKPLPEMHSSSQIVVKTNPGYCSECPPFFLLSPSSYCWVWWHVVWNIPLVCWGRLSPPSFLCTPSLLSGNIPLSFFQSEQSQLSQPFLTEEMLQSFHHLCDPLSELYPMCPCLSCSRELRIGCRAPDVAWVREES